MAQVFGPNANSVTRLVLTATGLLAVLSVAAAYALPRSGYIRDMFRAPAQPVPFSHEHHAGGLGIDCRYCHYDVEVSSFAGLPSTDTCMTCHSQIWTDAPMLAPVRQSLATGEPLRWTRVHDLPDFVYFDHSIHVAKGVGCVTCHGRVDRMPLTEQRAPLTMGWCLDCHRNPAPNLRPLRHVFDMDWQPPEDREALGRRLMRAYGVHPEMMTDCYVCHR